MLFFNATEILLIFTGFKVRCAIEAVCVEGVGDTHEKDIR